MRRLNLVLSLLTISTVFSSSYIDASSITEVDESNTLFHNNQIQTNNYLNQLLSDEPEVLKLYNGGKTIQYLFGTFMLTSQEEDGSLRNSIEAQYNPNDLEVKIKHFEQTGEKPQGYEDKSIELGQQNTNIIVPLDHYPKSMISNLIQTYSLRFDDNEDIFKFSPSYIKKDNTDYLNNKDMHPDRLLLHPRPYKAIWFHDFSIAQLTRKGDNKEGDNPQGDIGQYLPEGYDFHGKTIGQICWQALKNYKYRYEATDQLSQRKFGSIESIMNTDGVVTAVAYRKLHFYMMYKK